MATWLRRLIVLLFGLAFLIAPIFLVRSLGSTPAMGSPYEPPDAQLPELAATPIPSSTPAPAPLDRPPQPLDAERGHVVVDLAHFSALGPTQFQPLANHLADHGLELRFWMSDTDLMTLNFDTMDDLPDQSAELATLLEDAVGLVAVNPAFWWTPQEIALVEDFVAEGGRLVLISDPDVSEPDEYFVPDINTLSDAFGVVFNKDYLYNLEHNDLNFAHIFVEEFVDQAADLDGDDIVFYGARSISGPVTSQMRTGSGTVSSLRTGATSFTTAATIAYPHDAAAHNVLALGDFDVLTEPFVNRYENRRVVDHVAQFLAAAQQEETLADFPEYLGQDVALLLGDDMPVGKQMLEASSRLQRHVEDTGRQLSLVSADQVVLTGTHPLSTGLQDTIFVGSYEVAAKQTRLLLDAGIQLTFVPLEKSETSAGTSPIEDDEAADESESGAETPSPITPTIKTELMNAEEVTDTTEITATLVLEMESGPSFVAAETVVLLRQKNHEDHWITAALGSDGDTEEGISASIDRLLSGSYADCLTYPDLILCPVDGEQTADDENGDEKYLPPEPSDLPSLDDGETDQIPTRTSNVLLIDDDALAQIDEISEGDIYFSALLDAGYFPDLWYTSLDGIPDSADISGYDWVIWSAGEYAENSFGLSELETLVSVLEEGSAITISAWQLPIASDDAPSPLRDVVMTQEVPELVANMPNAPITLPEGLPDVVPLPQPEVDEAAAMIRGDESGDADAPVMLVAGYDGPPTAGGPQAIVVAMSLTWLPEEDALQLVTNMLSWVFNE
jgi:hypothetical protein